MIKSLIIRKLGLKSYINIVNDMYFFTKFRNKYSIDEIWFVQHFEVFTQGRYVNIKNNFIINNIPVIKSDRGGQITYHSPGQQLVYFLLDLNRRKLNIRKFIFILENVVISTLLFFLIKGHTCYDAPGVYVGAKKICSIGLRISKGCSLYGFALNINMNLLPFSYINPCGYLGLSMTQLFDLSYNVNINFDFVLLVLIKELIRFLSFF